MTAADMNLKGPAEGTQRRGAATAAGPVFRWTFETVTGDEAREVQAAQTKATMELAKWLLSSTTTRSQEEA
jgi:hypothetical protein